MSYNKILLMQSVHIQKYVNYNYNLINQKFMITYWRKFANAYLFCKFRYFKDLANEIQYTLPKINQQLGFQNDDKCWLIGYRLKPTIEPNAQIVNEQQPIATFLQKQKKQPKIEQTQQNNNQVNPISSSINLQYDPLSRENLAFGDIYKFAQQNDMDVCMSDSTNKQVSLTKLRESIYRRYYQTKLFKQNSTSKKYKQIRLPENINDYDILTKVENIKSLIKKGDYKFKIYAENDSKKSQKAVKTLCGFLGRNASVKIEEHILQEKSKGKAKIAIERWTTMLDFSAESKVDYQRINRKWKRHLLNMKLQKQGKTRKNQFNLQGLEYQSIQTQRQIIQQMRQMKLPLPSQFKDYQNLENMMQLSGKAHFFKFQQNKIKQMSQQSVEQSKQALEYKQLKQDKKYIQTIQQNLKVHHSKIQQQLKNIKVSQSQLKQMRKIMKIRTVQDILQEIQSIKGEKIELDSYEIYRLKALEIQLKETLKLAGYKAKI